MTEDIKLSTAELQPLAEGLAKIFVQRWDLYPQQMDNGSYICVKQPLTTNHLIAHLQGDITLGVYILNPDSQANFIVIDADDEDQFAQMVYLATSLAHQQVPTYLERSRRGGHLWFFFESAIPGIDVRAFGRGVLAAHDLTAGIELYPKQDALQDGPGSLIRLPFGVHRKDGNRYGFVHPSGRKLSPLLQEQMPLLFAPQTVSMAAFDTFKQLGQPKPPAPEFTPTEAARDTLSASIKAAISVQDFVSQYVELTSAGRGHCPFHDDRNHSFSINTEQNYWHCFAGCGGGSIIDFWMKRQGCDFKTAVGELAKLLLK